MNEHPRQGNVRENSVFPRSGYDVAGKNEILQKNVREISGNFTCQLYEARMFDLALIISGKF